MQCTLGESWTVAGCTWDPSAVNYLLCSVVSTTLRIERTPHLEAGGARLAIVDIRELLERELREGIEEPVRCLLSVGGGCLRFRISSAPASNERSCA